MEWIFFVTKPSFMSGMTLWSQIKIYLLSALGLCILPVLIIVILGSVDRALQAKFVRTPLISFGLIIPVWLISSLILLLFDNFTYTVFGFGIVSTERFLRAAYGICFIVLLLFSYYKIRRYILVRSKKKHPVRRDQAFFVLGITAIAAISSFVSNAGNSDIPNPALTQNSVKEKLPNIILLGSDGLDAAHFSVYGYERDTTPNIRELSKDALVAENVFANAGTTGGSIASIMTSKLPLETGVIYPPDILRGVDAYQHLPGILKRMGYHTVDLSVPYYGDAITLNLLDGYDIANQRSNTNNLIIKITRSIGGGDSAYFVGTMLQRISDRLLHIFFLQPMLNPYEFVIQPASRSNEQNRFNELIALLEESETPVFVHVHMLGTHGPLFEIREQVFSIGQTQEDAWMVDFYDDAILNFDQYVGELFSYLSKTGQLENTIIIVYSDHGMMWSTNQRVPLIFWFPEGNFKKRIKDHVQNIDIAPTILDYLDQSIPEWMDGQSLLEQNLKPSDYIFSASVESSLVDVTKDGLWAVEMERRSPPFYQVGYVGLIVCDRWYELYVQNPRMLHGNIKDLNTPCGLGTVPDPEYARQILLEYLFNNGYDISSFPTSVPIHFIE
jgi:hypothetical protein